ncbi:hypothetical protein [Methylobacterium sp. 1973]|uniref:hypothetical protein n=1 Tax=Methylobacterium sp. 1973 TaxID=3156421 RepID=UPI003396AFD0
MTDASDLSRPAWAVRVAADDALALAARTDHLAHLCREDAGQNLNSLADATRRHAEELDRAAAFVARCERIPGLIAMVEAMERGTLFVPVEPVSAGRSPLPADVVVVGQDNAASLRERVGRGLARLKRRA